MAHPLIHANVIQKDGTYYQVKLHTVPRVGERIELTSIRNIETGHHDQTALSYEVNKVVHKLHDITDKVPNGSHEIEIFVSKAG